MRVLVVEDYRPLADLVAEGLTDQGMAADVAYDGTRPSPSSTSTPTTWWCWTATCQGSMATLCARGFLAEESEQWCSC